MNAHIAVVLVSAVVAAFLVTEASSSLYCFSCQGNGISCEASNTYTYCTSPQIYCRMDVTTGTYPFVEQSCAADCQDYQDTTRKTFCSRYNFGNCYQSQCNRVAGASSVAAGIVLTVAMSTAACLL